MSYEIYKNPDFHIFHHPGKETFTLEDCLERKGMYVVKKGNTDEEVFRIIFDDEGKLLTVKQRSA